MKRIVILTLCCLLWTFKLKANHLFGGELYYTHISGLTYKVTLALYGDCGSRGTSTSFGLLPTARPLVTILNNQTQFSVVQLTLETNGTEITPVCAEEANNTQCGNLNSTIPGIMKFVYSDTVTLPAPSTKWTFAFNGDLNNGTSAGRSTGITNIILNPSTGGTYLLYLKAELDNSAGFNNSPQFTAIPTPFYCVNTLQEYNQGAIDSDGDSLSFELSPALDHGTAVIYAPGYSPTSPISTQSGSFNFNPINGQMTFIPDILQKGVVVNKVYEYRNGVVVGSSMREMTFIVLDNCNNTAPGGDIDTTTIAGAVYTSGNILNVCRDEPLVSFSYSFADPDGDTVELSFAGVPTGASLNIVNNQTPNPSIDFNWNTSDVPTGNYTFFVTARDRHCPLSTTQTRGFTIRVVNQNEMHHTVLKPTQCAHKAVLQFFITEGLSPRTYTFKQGNTVVRTFSDTSNSFIDSLYAGSYSLTVASRDLLCPTTYDFMVSDSGVFPYNPIFNDNIVCDGADTGPLQAIAFPGATLHWFDIDGSPLPSAPVPSSTDTATQYWLISQLYNVCESTKDTIVVNVKPKPEVKLLSGTSAVCIGERVYLKATGAMYYIWQPQEKLFYEPDSSVFIRIYQPEDFTVIGFDTTGCSDTVRFSYTDVLQCCTFSYPTAFTPNNDGKNDTWHPVVYGIQDRYELSIYNRWGQVLFHSFIPNEAWDGRFNGVPQEMGSYHYLLRAKCLTGKEEFRAGDFMLLR